MLLIYMVDGFIEWGKLGTACLLYLPEDDRPGPPDARATPTSAALCHPCVPLEPVYLTYTSQRSNEAKVI